MTATIVPNRFNPKDQLEVFTAIAAADQLLVMRSGVAGVVASSVLMAGVSATFDANGIDVNPGSDADADLITVGVTDTPKFWWDESEDAFNLTKPLQLPAGTVAAPSLCFVGEKDSGMYLSAANEVSLATAGTKRLTLSAVGSVAMTEGSAAEPTIGGELAPALNNTGYTLGAGWSQDGATIIHASGGGTAALTMNNLTGLTTGASYRLTIAVTPGATGTLTLGITNALGFSTVPFGSAGLDTAFSPTSSTVSISLTPTSTFDRAVSSVSVKSVGGATGNGLIVQNSDGSFGTAIRGGGNGLYNIFIGANVGLKAVSPIGNNVGIGKLALASLVTGNYNVAIGMQAMEQTLGGYDNVAIGRLCGRSISNGSSNVCIGASTGASLTTGTTNVLIGTNVCGTLTVGNGNVALGYAALYNAATNENNVAIGYAAGRYYGSGTSTLTTAQSCIYIGYTVRGLAAVEDRAIVIGYNNVGLGSLTTVIGNPSTTEALLWGAHRLANVAAPAVAANVCHIYSTDQAAGNACPHIKTENGAVLKLYQGAAIADATSEADAVTKLNLLLAHLRLMGIIAP